MHATSCVVARATTRKTIHLEDETSDGLTVALGEPFRVLFAYRVYESSTDRETWTFNIRSSVDGNAVVAHSEHNDRPIFRDDLWSHVATEHIFMQPGTHEIHYEVEAEISTRPWGGTQQASVMDKKAHSGVLRVNVVG